jgi:hypothetical protein
LKKDISTSSSSTDEKKNDGILSDVSSNLDFKKPLINKLKLSSDLNVSILDADKSKIKIGSAIEKSNQR